MNSQEIYSTAKRKLLAQGRRSTKEGSLNACLYAGPDNTNCAVGVLLAPQELERVSSWENTEEDDTSVSTLFKAFPDIARRLGKDNIPLLEDLQTLHDFNKPEEWPDEFAKVAAKFGLEDK